MATLYVLQGPDKGKTFHTGNSRTLLGRSSEDMPLTDNSISRRHAELLPENGHWMLRDLKSANGTYVNGLRVDLPTMMKHGDQIRIGMTLLVFGGDQLEEQFTTRSTRDLMNLDATGGTVDSAVIETLPSNEASMILAAPETVEAVRAWRIMYQLTEAIGAIVSADQLLNRVMDIIFEQMEVDRGFILMVEEDRQELMPKVIRYRRNPSDPQKITTSGTIIKHVMNRCEGILCTNAMSDQRFGADNVDDSIHRYGLTSVICVPIIAHKKIHGVIHMDCSMSEHTYTMEQLRLANAIGHMTGMAIENAKLIESRVANERLAAAGETVAFLSHYIKNVLQGLRSGADVLELGLQRKSYDTIEQGWGILDRSLDKVLSLTINMLAFSKNREPKFVMAQVNSVVQEAVGIAQRFADSKNVVLLTDFDDLPAVPINTDGIHQIALNLVTNAVQAVESDTGIVNVRTHYSPDDGAVIFTVEDNGPGIPPERLHEIFQPFKSSKGQGGTGLGLAAAKKIAEEHQAKLAVHNIEPHGSAFEVKISAYNEQFKPSDETLEPSPK